MRLMYIRHAVLIPEQKLKGFYGSLRAQRTDGERGDSGITPHDDLEKGLTHNARSVEWLGKVRMQVNITPT